MVITDDIIGANIEIDGTLKVGATSDLKTASYTIPASYNESTFKNIATVTAAPINPDTKKVDLNRAVTDTDDHVIKLEKWSATKTANKQVVVAGDTVTYTITVKNEGATVLSKVEVSDPTINFAKVVLTDIAVGGSKSVTATYVIPKTFKGTEFKNVALVCVPNKVVNEDPDCKEPTVTVKIINISIVKTADKDSATPGDKVVYTFVVTNTGGATINPTEINDDVLGVIGDPGELAPGKSQTFTKEYTVPSTAKDGDVIKNVATVCASTKDDVTSANTTDCVTTCPASSLTTVCAQDTHTLKIIAPSISIEKTADKETASPGDSVVYTFVITNTSSVDLLNVTVTDNVLGDLGTIDKIVAGGTATKSVTYVVPQDATEAIRNVATACFTTPVATDNCASDDHVLNIVVVAGESVTRVAGNNASLPFTGASSTWMAIVATLMLGAGVAIYLLTRKRKTA